MNIGNIKIEKFAALAPMAGVGDRAFREICVENGASFVVGEMCSAKGITYGSAKSAELLIMGEEEKPCAVQLFGEEPDVMAKAVEMIQQYNPQIIDINMGCPAPKITSSGSGCSLMRNLPLAEQIIKSAVKSSSVPITVKFRKGWNEETINAVELAHIAENSGASAVTIHGRTKAQMYTRPIDLDIIRKVKKSVSIPVIGNGGIQTLEDVIKMYEYTNCDLVMIGEGVLGKPWFFQQIKAHFLGDPIPAEPTVEEKLAILRRQVQKAVDYKNEKVALREARTHVGWYMHGLSGAASFRRESGQLNTLEDLDRFIEMVLQKTEDFENQEDSNVQNFQRDN